MPELELLVNSGVLALNKPEVSSPEKTVVVLGVARGGTTMVASVLQALGVHMGEKLGPVMEDVALSEAVENRSKAQIKKIVAQRNELYPIWGWKRPSAIEHSNVWQNAFRNPYIVAVFRDPFAISNRNRISMLSDIFKDMERSMQHLGALATYLRQCDKPVLCCSYEKVLTSPESFVKAVDAFLDLNAESKWPNAVAQINPASKEYLDNSRITHSLGHLDAANRRLCSGWAFYQRQPQRVAKVRILVNDQLVHTVEAKLMRADVKDKGIHPTGLCGFRLEWADGLAPQPGDRVEAWVEGDVKPLGGSPRVVAEKTAAPQ